MASTFDNAGMNEPQLAPEVRGYYERGGERDRLTVDGRGRLELLRTQDVLRRELADGRMSVLDVGGAYGVHARWLAGDGHRVHVVDPVADHVRAAAAVPGVTAETGDARALPCGDDEYDATLLLGPLYHLQTEAERVRALREAVRVTRPDGLVAAATINRYSAWHDVMSRHLLGSAEWMLPVLEHGRLTGEHRPPTEGLFTTAYFHQPAQVVVEFAAAGLRRQRQYGLEGTAWLVDGIAADLDDPRTRLSLMDGLRASESEPALLGASSHLLTVADVVKPPVAAEP